MPPPPPPPPPPGGGFSTAPQPGPYGTAGYQPYTGGPPMGPDTGQAFSYGWKKFQEHLGQIAVAIAIWFVAGVVLVGIGFVLQTIIAGGSEECRQTAFGEICTTTGASFFASFVGSLVFYLFYLLAYTVGSYVIIKGALAITAGRPVTKDELFNFGNFVPFLLTGIVVSIITAVGFVLCVIPGIIAAFVLYLANYYAADRGMSVGDALSASYRVMSQNVGKMVVFILATWLAQFVGALLCGVGLLVAIPVIIIASAYMYRTLNGEPVAA